jgi:hypothetical protein
MATVASSTPWALASFEASLRMWGSAAPISIASSVFSKKLCVLTADPIFARNAPVGGRRVLLERIEREGCPAKLHPARALQRSSRCT